MLLGVTKGESSGAETFIVLTIYLLLGAIALIVDRRALMVSALAYVLAAVISLFNTFGMVSLNIALAIFVIGSGLLLLSAFWHSVRRALVTMLPGTFAKSLAHYRAWRRSIEQLAGWKELLLRHLTANIC